MRLLTARVLNYKSFSDSGVVALSGGFNVVLGRNDAGKSAFLEALSLRMTSKPHRSLETVPDRQWPVDSLSTVHLSLSVSKAELVAILSRHETIFVPVFDGSTAEQTQRLFEMVVDDPGTFHGVWSNGLFQRGAFARFGEIRSVVQSVVVTNTKQPRAFAPRFGVISNASSPTYADIIAAALPERIFLFRAERLSVGEHLATGNHVLTPNASNLAEAINSLQTSNPPLFEAYLGHVKSVFPHITQITAPIIPGTTSLARIMVWGVPVDSTRDDLAIPLNESGTGIGQVLAMLYVAVTSYSATTILIDEPHSFLHPGAVTD